MGDFKDKTGIDPKVKAVLTAIASVAAIATANATDLATAVALANANKAKINEILAAIKALG